MKTRFILVRHGQSEGNARRIILGHTDWDLTDLGREQAECTAAALGDRSIDAVYSSDLLRAFNTVLPMAKARNLEVIPEKDLREIHLGIWEGMAVSDVIEQYGDLYTVEWREHFGTFTPLGGEPVRELGYRIKNALARIGDECPGKTVLIGCHAAAIRSFWGAISGVPFEALAETIPFPDNASYSEVDYEEGIFTPVSFSESSHLAELITKIPF